MTYDTTLRLRELRVVSKRIFQMRQELYAAILQNNTPGDWSHIVNQIGMFTYTGLSSKLRLNFLDIECKLKFNSVEAQVQAMTQKHHIYMLSNGRINVAGLNSKTCLAVANAMHDVVVQE